VSSNVHISLLVILFDRRRRRRRRKRRRRRRRRIKNDEISLLSETMGTLKRVNCFT